MYAQIREPDKADQPNTLAVHRVRDDGTPACGDLVRPWQGKEMVLVVVPDVDMPHVLSHTGGMCGRNGCKG